MRDNRHVPQEGDDLFPRVEASVPVTLDFETRSAADLKKVGAYKYAAHPSTIILCMAWTYDKVNVFTWHPGMGPTRAFVELLRRVRDGEELHAHNAEFEYNIWNRVGGRLHAFPPAPIDQFVCDAANAARLALPRALEKVAAAIQAPVQKDMEGHALMKRMTRPRKPRKAELLWEAM